MEQALEHFQLNGKPLSCVPYGEGHINLTFLVETDQGIHYILQRLSRAAFQNIPGLMGNIIAVTGFLNQKSTDARSCLHLVPTTEGAFFHRDEAGEYWRVYDFIEDSICLQAAESPEDFYQSSLAFGRFQRDLRDFPADTLCETIPDFHNTPDRYRKFRCAIEADSENRLRFVKPEVDFLLEREEEAGRLQKMRESGELPLRVTHNDTKLNNVMLDAVTREALCVIDLDTTMPGLVAYDFGDAVRFGASTAREDEKDLSRVELSLALYETYVRGFIPACGGLTEKEVETLPLGAKTMTLENGMRFLTDYLEGDHYYHTAYPEHNLDRCRTQLKLVSDMEQKWSQMEEIVKKR